MSLVERFTRISPAGKDGALTDIGITKLLVGSDLVGVSAVSNEVNGHLWELVVMIHPTDPPPGYQPFPATPGKYGMGRFVQAQYYSTVPWNGEDAPILDVLFGHLPTPVAELKVHLRNFEWRPMNKHQLDPSKKGRRTRFKAGGVIRHDHGVWVNEAEDLAHGWNVVDEQGAYSVDGYKFREHRTDKDTIEFWMNLSPSHLPLKWRTADLTYDEGPVTLQRP